MPRKKCLRIISAPPREASYKPAGIPLRYLDEVVLHADEMEALRLADHQKLYHEQAAGVMKVSRQTFGRILTRAREKVAGALVDGLAIRIEGVCIKSCCTPPEDTI